MTTPNESSGQWSNATKRYADHTDNFQNAYRTDTVCRLLLLRFPTHNARADFSCPAVQARRNITSRFSTNHKQLLMGYCRQLLGYKLWLYKDVHTRMADGTRHGCETMGSFWVNKLLASLDTRVKRSYLHSSRPSIKLCCTNKHQRSDAKCKLKSHVSNVKWRSMNNMKRQIWEHWDDVRLVFCEQVSCVVTSFSSVQLFSSFVDFSLLAFSFLNLHFMLTKKQTRILTCSDDSLSHLCRTEHTVG